MRTLALLSSLVLTTAVLLWWTSSDPALAQADAVAMDLEARSFSLSLGEGSAEAADWSGQVSVRGGRILGPNRWQAAAQRTTKKADRVHTVRPGSAAFTVAGGREAEVSTPQGTFRFAPGALGLGTTAAFLDGKALVRRSPVSAAIAQTGEDEDFPACAAAADSSIWCAYVAYDRGAPVRTDATAKGDFGSLRPTDNGDQVRLVRFKDGAWQRMGGVSKERQDVWRPAIVFGPSGGQVLWSAQQDGDWNLYARSLNPADGSLGPEQRLTQTPGADINAVAAADSRGRLWLAWQGWRNGNFDIWLQELADGAQPARVSASAANDWNPSIAAGPDGAVWVAWDTYDKGDYDVYARRAAAGKLDEPLPVAASARFEARASVAVDSKGRPWVAFEDAGENWGKDYGDRWPGRQAVPFYQDRYIRVRTLEAGKAFETKAQFHIEPEETFRDDPKKPTMLEHRISMPRIAFDPAGRLWMLYRQHPLRNGMGEIWASYATWYEADRWAEPVPIPGSSGLIDNRPALSATQGGLMAVYSTDKREVSVQDAKDNDLHAAFLRKEGAAAPAVLREVDPLGESRPMMPIHPDESGDVERLRTHEITVGGKTYRILRGEFHRHSEISSHRDWDGPLEEVWRYGLDVAQMDWIGPGDHDYGRENDYLWWLTQKQGDLYYHPGAFLTMHTYERSQVYPSGHRNVMFAVRGVRPLPRLDGREAQFGTYEGGSDDIRNLYSYLRAFGGICSSHTSSTNMGTDWRDADPELEPVVEIFQGHRLSAEEPNAPLAPSGPDEAIQGFRPLGFVWEAFKRGRKLGFQSSSDHVSTHISYGMVLVEDATREGVIAGFKKRHSYAANDNILLDVRSGEHLMGDELTTKSLPRLDVVVHGTTPVERIDIVRQIEGESPAYIAAFEPGTAQVSFSWTDGAAQEGKTQMYYVRVQQRNGALAWASPLWVRYEPE
ncbi:MAG: hypothetical protein GC160_28565 [Acidobacteria bacterium]|nr:hypothetical protein [Acidobacteriota bacterium]